jgi:hypothetical protein
MLKMDRFETGGNEYYICFNRGQHELRECVEDENLPDTVIAEGHYTFCTQVRDRLIKSNIDYDYNL